MPKTFAISKFCNLCLASDRSFIYVNEIKIEIQTGKDDVEDAKDKSFDLLKIIEIADAFATGVGIAAQGIAQLLY